MRLVIADNNKRATGIRDRLAGNMQLPRGIYSRHCNTQSSEPPACSVPNRIAVEHPDERKQGKPHHD